MRSADGHPGAARLTELGAVAAVLAAVAIAAAVPWHTLGDPIIDCGRDLMTAVRIAGGEVLYRDIQYNYGPLSPYLRGLAVQVFGWHLDVFRGIGVVVLAAVALLAYTVVRRFHGPAVSAGCAIALVALVGTAQYAPAGGYNFLVPYAAPAIDGIALSLGAIRLAMAGNGPVTIGRAAAGGFLVAAVALTKLELAAAAALAWWVRLAIDREWRGLAVNVACSLTSLPVYGFFAAEVGLATLVGDHLLPEGVVTGGNGLFPARLMGVHDPVKAVRAIAVSGACLGAAALLAGWLGRRIERGFAWRVAYASSVIGVALACAMLLTPGTGLRVLWPLALVAAIAAVVRKRRDIAPLAVFAAASSLRVAFNLGPHWFGFYLLIAPFALAWVIAFRWAERAALTPRGALAARAFLLVVAAALVADFVATSARFQAARTVWLEGPNGALLAPPSRGRVLASVIATLDARRAPGDRLLVFPEGAMLNFLLGMPHPAFHGSFVPPEIPSARHERRLVADLETGRPRFVVLVSRPLAEFGRTAFGVDYAQEAWRRVTELYHEVARFHEPPDDVTAVPFSAIVMERRP